MDLLNFLAQAAGLAGPVDYTGQQGEDITVSAARPIDPMTPASVNPEPAFRIPSTPTITRDPAGQGVPLGGGRPREKLTFRDILGGLGDALLVGNDVKPIYGPRREQEKLQDAVAIYQQDKKAGLRAIASINPDLVLQVAQQDEENQIKKLTAETLGGQRQSVALKNEFDQAARVVGALGKNPGAWPLLLPRIRALVEKAGYDPALVPDQYSDEIPQQLLALGQTGYQQERLDQGDTRLAQQGQQVQQQGDNIQSMIAKRDADISVANRRAATAEAQLEVMRRRVAELEKMGQFNRDNPPQSRRPGGGRPRGDQVPTATTAPAPKTAPAKPGPAKVAPTTSAPIVQKIDDNTIVYKGQRLKYSGKGPKTDSRNWIPE